MSRESVENASYLAFVKRILRTLGERIGEGDDFDMGELVSVRDDLESAIAAAVKGQRAQGQSWQYIADGLGVKRQSAYERYAERIAS